MVTIDITIIDQIAKFLKNLVDFEFDLKNSGNTKIKTAIKKIAGIISSNPIF
jgi:phosphopantothenate synthetase